MLPVIIIGCFYFVLQSVSFYCYAACFTGCNIYRHCLRMRHDFVFHNHKGAYSYVIIQHGVGGGDTKLQTMSLTLRMVHGLQLTRPLLLMFSRSMLLEINLDKQVLEFILQLRVRLLPVRDRINHQQHLLHGPCPKLINRSFQVYH